MNRLASKPGASTAIACRLAGGSYEERLFPFWWFELLLIVAVGDVDPWLIAVKVLCDEAVAADPLDCAVSMVGDGVSAVRGGGPWIRRGVWDSSAAAALWEGVAGQREDEDRALAVSAPHVNNPPKRAGRNHTTTTTTPEKKQNHLLWAWNEEDEWILVTVERPPLE